jgi:hypothetical protein
MSGVVEVDETFIGRLEGMSKGKGGWADKNVALTLVERGGSARSFHVGGTRVADIVPIVKANLQREVALTDGLLGACHRAALCADLLAPSRLQAAS